MDWSRLGAATVEALRIAFLLGALFSPPDPITQLVVIPIVFLVTLAVTYRNDSRLYARGWKRHALFLVSVFATQAVWDLLVRTASLVPSFYSPVRLGILFTGVALGAWLAYFGGLERLRGGSAESGESGEEGSEA
jgi:predicted Na+-dependent transporter